MWLVGGNGASGFVFEDGMLSVATGANAVIVEQLVVAGAEQDQVFKLRLAATLDRG